MMKKIRVCLILLSALMLSASHLIFADTASADYFQQALKLKQSGKYSESERMLKKALEFDSANTEYHFELANLYALRHDKSKNRFFKEEMLESAQRELAQTIMLAPDFLPAHYNLGVVYKKQANYELAREAFRNALEIDPNQPGAYMQLGNVYEAQGFFDEAKESYLKAKELNYNHPEIESALAQLKQNREEYNSMRSRTDDLSRMSRLYGNFQFSPQSTPSKYLNQSAGENSSMAQTIPFLGAWLIDQFMSYREKQKD